MEKPLYPSQYMRITEGYMKGSHRDSYAIDDAGIDQGIDYLKAPYTGVIKKIYQKDANEIWLESIEPVIYPDGTVDYLTMLFAHDNDISNLFVGKVIAKGERFYEEGTKGEAESPKEESQNLQLIYTCRKSYTYAINLNNGDKLYIEKYKP